MAADYSQLELRIIAHLSKDRKLIEVLNGGEDVFKAIASQLKMVSIESVTTEQRQQAKQVNKLFCATNIQGWYCAIRSERLIKVLHRLEHITHVTR